MDVPAGVAGTVLALLVEEGDDVPVKSPIAVVGEPGETVDAPAAPAAQTATGSASSCSRSARADSAGTTPAPAPVVPRPTTPRPHPREGCGRRRRHPRTGGWGRHRPPSGGSWNATYRRRLASGPGLTAGARGLGRPARPPPAPASAAGSRPPTSPPRRRPLPRRLLLDATPAPVAPHAAGAFTDTPLKGIRKLIADRDEGLAGRLGAAVLRHVCLCGGTARPAGPAQGDRPVARPQPRDDRRPASASRRPRWSGTTRTSTPTCSTGRCGASSMSTWAWRSTHRAASWCRRSATRARWVCASSQPPPRTSPRSARRARSALTCSRAPRSRCRTSVPSGSRASRRSSTCRRPASSASTPSSRPPTIDKDGNIGVERRISFSLTADHQVVDGADAATLPA